MSDFDIYLDIDGVIKGTAAPQQDLYDLLEYLLDNFSGCLYWLTTHCRGGVNNSRNALSGVLPEPLLERVCRQFEMAEWGALKTDGIDFRRDFIWFDDNMFQSEIAVLESLGAEDNFCLVMPRDPDSAKDMLRCVKDKLATYEEA